MEKTFQQLAKKFSAKITKNSDGYIDYVEVKDKSINKTIKSHHFIALKLGLNYNDEETDNNDYHVLSNDLRDDPDFKIFLVKLTLYNSYKSSTSVNAQNLISEVTKYVDGQSGGKRKKQKTKTNKRKITKSKTNKRKKRTRRRR